MKNKKNDGSVVSNINPRQEPDAHWVGDAQKNLTRNPGVSVKRCTDSHIVAYLCSSLGRQHSSISATHQSVWDVVLLSSFFFYGYFFVVLLRLTRCALSGGKHTPHGNNISTIFSEKVRIRCLVRIIRTTWYVIFLDGGSILRWLCKPLLWCTNCTLLWAQHIDCLTWGIDIWGGRFLTNSYMPVLPAGQIIG